jgi:hypothetical protein
MQTIEAPRETARPTIERAPRWARWFVWSFLAMFAICGVVGIEAWPFTGFRLFSHLRHERQIDWQAFAVHPDGREAWLPLSRFPGGYNGLPLVMKGFASRSPRERAEMCRAWSDAAHGLRGETVAIRIYEIDRRLEPRSGRRPMIAPKRTLVQTCADHIELKGTTIESG